MYGKLTRKCFVRDFSIGTPVQEIARQLQPNIILYADTDLKFLVNTKNGYGSDCYQTK